MKKRKTVKENKKAAKKRSPINESGGGYYDFKPLTMQRLREALNRVIKKYFYDAYIPWAKIEPVESYRYVGYFDMDDTFLGEQPVIFVSTIFDYSDFQLDSLIAHELVHAMEYMRFGECSHGRYFHDIARILARRGMRVTQYAEYMDKFKLSRKASALRLRYGNFTNLFSDPEAL